MWAKPQGGGFCSEPITNDFSWKPPEESYDWHANVEALKEAFPYISDRDAQCQILDCAVNVARNPSPSQPNPDNVVAWEVAMDALYCGEDQCSFVLADLKNLLAEIQACSGSGGDSGGPNPHAPAPRQPMAALAAFAGAKADGDLTATAPVAPEGGQTKKAVIPHYRVSRASEASDLGMGWTSNFHVKISDLGNGSVVLTSSIGNQHTYTGSPSVGQLSGRLHAKSFAEQDFREVGIVPCCIESLVLDTNFRC